MSGAYYNEFDPRAAAWLRELIRRGLIADGVVDERSILDVSADDLRGFTQCHFFAGIGGWSYALRLAGWPDDRPVWTGSPPCQPFSAAGQNKGKDDERHLAPHFITLVSEGRPPMLFGEQVASAAVFGKAAKGAGKAADGRPEWTWIDDLQDRLEAAHYAVGASDIPAAGVGAPHIRQRTFFGAVRTEHTTGNRRIERWTEPSRGRTLPGCGAVRMADADIAVKGVVRFGSEILGCGSEGFARLGRRSSSTDDRLADAGSRGSAQGIPEPQQRQDWVAGKHDHSGCEHVGREAAPAATRTGTSHDPWRDADWLWCRDAKWRPVEPGTFPLAHGVPARVVRLRGYGNAIVPQAAAAFVLGFEDVAKNLGE